MDTYNFRTVLHSWCSAVVLYIYIIEINYIFLCLLHVPVYDNLCRKTNLTEWLRSLQINRIPGEKNPQTLSVYWLAQFVDILFIE